MARVTQNPSNKVGRNSGAGPGGVSQVVPTRREAERGLQPLWLDEPSRWSGRIGMGIGALALVGAGVAALAVQRRRQRHGLRAGIDRVQEFIHWR